MRDLRCPGHDPGRVGRGGGGARAGADRRAAVRDYTCRLPRPASACGRPRHGVVRTSPWAPGAREKETEPMAIEWPRGLYDLLKQQGVRQVGVVPDAGHLELIGLCERDAELRTVRLTTEEEGVALALGAWLGGDKSVLLLQSSGVGNCINMLSMLATCPAPLAMLVTMRGDWAEFNPWQGPMGKATQPVLGEMGVLVERADP